MTFNITYLIYSLFVPLEYIIKAYIKTLGSKESMFFERGWNSQSQGKLGLISSRFLFQNEHLLELYTSREFYIYYLHTDYTFNGGILKILKILDLSNIFKQFKSLWKCERKNEIITSK